MTPSKKLKIRLLAAMLGLSGLLAVAEIPAYVGFNFVTPAEARIGRPLTPVSVAGVARRTVRRCAVGVYYC